MQNLEQFLTLENAIQYNNLTDKLIFIADELENVFPSWVTIQESSEKEKLYIEDNKVKTISLPFYFDAIIVESIKKQQEEIEMLKTSILELELLIKNR